MRKAFKSLSKRLMTETHGVLLLFRRCRNMQIAPDTKHDLFLLLSNANQPVPKQLESFVDQLRNVCHQLEQVCAVSVLFPLGAHGEAGGNRSLQHFGSSRVAVVTGNQTMPGPLETLTILTPYMILTAAEALYLISAVSRGIKDNLIARERTPLAGQL